MKLISIKITIIFLFLTTPGAWAMGRRPPVEEEIPVFQPPTPAPLSLTLGNCYELALRRSETVAIQKEEIKEAEAQFFIASSEAMGDVDFILQRTLQQELKAGGDESVSGSFRDPDRRERRFTVTQPLFQGFKALGALTGAGSLRHQQKEEWRRARQLLLLDVAQAFYGLLRERRNVDTVSGIYSLFQERIKELSGREEIGRSRASEVVTAQARLKVLEAERARSVGALAAAQNLLEFLTGIKLAGRELSEEEFSSLVPRVLEDYLESMESRPDVEAAKQAAKTAWRAVIVEQSAFWPEVTMEHNQYDRREGLQAQIDWDFLFKITVPLSRGGETIGKVKQAVSRWKKSKLAYRKARREASLDIQQNYEHWTTSLEETRALADAVKASEENFRLQKDEYAHNLVSNLDVLEALESLRQTRREANAAHYQMKENYWRLRVAAGEVL